MKKIRIKELRLLNFCGIRDAEYEFSDKLTIVSGGNGRGKSTIANAIMYVLFGTDMVGNTLDIKTFNENHEIIKEIPHEAELTLLVDGEQVVLKRTLTDSWKGSECKNTYKYYVDGDVTTAGDFKKVVEDICPDSVFRRISSATNFCSLPWQKQRELLESLADQYSTQDVTQDCISSRITRVSLGRIRSPASASRHLMSRFGSMSPSNIDAAVSLLSRFIYTTFL